MALYSSVAFFILFINHLFFIDANKAENQFNMNKNNGLAWNENTNNASQHETEKHRFNLSEIRGS